MTDEVKDKIEAIFKRIVSGNIGTPGLREESGWEMELPSGKKVTRSVLQAEAETAVALGVVAVPYLLPFVRSDVLAVRYVAIFALEQITGEKSRIPYFKVEGAAEEIESAIRNWSRWYEEHRTG